MENFYNMFKKNLRRSFSIIVCFLFICSLNAYANHQEDQAKVIATLKNAKSYIHKYGIEKSIIEFRKNHDDIFMADYSGMFYVSPLHPELIGKNEFDYKDPSGVLVVQEEINKAKTGGGWLKGRWRKDPKTGEYVCRKIYILPVSDNYFIGSWYHYPSSKEKTCLI